MAWSLCTQQDVLDLYPIGLSELKPSWSDMAEGMIRERLGFIYLGISGNAIVEEVYNGNGSNFMRVKSKPIKTVEEVNIGGYAVPSAEYVVGTYFIQLMYTTFTAGIGNIKLSYTPGPGIVPENVRMSAVQMVAACANYYGRQGSDGSLRWGDLDVKVGDESPVSKVGLAGHLKSIMDENLQVHNLRIG